MIPPTDALLNEITTLDLTFPDGRTRVVTMSEWHWQYAEYLNRKEGAKRHSEGFLWDLLEKLGDVSGDVLAQTAMTNLREIYEVNKDRPIRWVPSGKYEKDISAHPSVTRWTGTTDHG